MRPPDGGESFTVRHGAVLAAILLVLYLLLACGCTSIAPRDDWQTDHTVAEVAFQLSNAVDALQTARIRDRDDLREGAPLTRAVLGPKPEARETALYFASVGVSHYLISRILPPKWRPWWQGGTLVYSGATVLNNCTQHGLLCGGQDARADRM